MKAFTLTENPVVGVHVDVRLGATNNLFNYPVSDELLGVVDRAVREEVVAFERSTFLRNHVIKDALDRAHGFLAGERSDTIPLARVDIEDGKLVPERNPRDRRALLHFRMAPGVGGHVVLTGNGSIEKIDGRGWVRRIPTPFPSLGIDILARDGDEYLLAMTPGSTFRVQRSGKLEGAAPTTIVHWDPGWGEVFLRSKTELHDGPLPWGFKVYHREREKRSEF